MLTCLLLSFSRTVYHWPVYHCLDTLCPSQPSPMEFGVNMLSSCSSKITSIFSAPTVLTPTTGDMKSDAVFNVTCN